MTSETRTIAQADLVIVGAGIAGTYTIRAIIRRLSDSEGGRRPLIVDVIDRDGFWSGVPYGQRSSFVGLVITTLAEFVPPAEHAAFTAWLTTNRDRWSELGRREGGGAFEEWLVRNGPAIDAGRFDDLYVPRRLFGLYLADVVEQEVAAAEARGLMTLRRTVGIATDLEAGQTRRHRVRVRSADGETTVEAHAVVLAVGSPPTRSARTQANGDVVPLIDDLYEPSFDSNLLRIAEALAAAAAGERNLLVLGTNASALELVYVLRHDPRFAALLEKAVTLSPSGCFPHRISGGPEIQPHYPRMQALATGAPTGALPVMEAAEADVADLVARGVPVADGFAHLGGLLVQILAVLPTDEAKTFNTRYGMRFSRLIRRAGREYRDAAEALRAEGRLESLAGRLRVLSRDTVSGGTSLSYETADGSLHRPDIPFAAVVNCVGFEEVDSDSSMPLVGTLLARGAVRPNETGRGLEVGDDLAAGDGIFVIGPLLAGIWNDRLRLWHVENVRRIESIAPLAAEAILADLTGKHG